jgi:hypothetical protein
MYNIQNILLCQIWDQVPVLISPRNRVARLYPQALGLVHSSKLATRGLALHSRGTDRRPENRATIVETHLLGLPRDRHPASSLAHWLTFVYWEHSSHCCALDCSQSCFLATRWSNMLQYQRDFPILTTYSALENRWWARRGFSCSIFDSCTCSHSRWLGT